MNQPAIDQEQARAVALAIVVQGPQSLAQIAAAMLNSGVPVGLIYFAARLAINQLIEARQIEAQVYHNGDTVWRLPESQQATRDGQLPQVVGNQVEAVCPA